MNDKIMGLDWADIQRMQQRGATRRTIDTAKAGASPSGMDAWPGWFALIHPGHALDACSTGMRDLDDHRMLASRRTAIALLLAACRPGALLSFGFWLAGVRCAALVRPVAWWATP